MKNKTIMMLVAGFTLFGVSAVSAQTVTPSPVPTQKFGQAVKEFRQENNRERKELQGTFQQEKSDLRENNKESREQFRMDTKNLMISKTPEERKALRPTIVQERKDLLKANKEERKTLRESIQAELTSFRATVKERWMALWNSFFGNK